MASQSYTRMQILDRIESGEITASEGIQLLQNLVSFDSTGVQEEKSQALTSPVINETTAVIDTTVPDQIETAIADETTAPDMAEIDESLEAATLETSAGELFMNGIKRKPRWWFIPLGVAAGISLAALVLMALAFRTMGVGFWFICSALMLVAGLVFGSLIWLARNAPWLYLSVEQRATEWPRVINLGFPFPLRIAAWFVHWFGPWLPESKKGSLEEMLLALDRSITLENPFHLKYEGRHDDERMELFIG